MSCVKDRFARTSRQLTGAPGSRARRLAGGFGMRFRKPRLTTPQIPPTKNVLANSVAEEFSLITAP